MLAGVGGKTIDQAQANMSYVEYMSWLNYRQKYGKLNPIDRSHRDLSKIAFILHAQSGGKMTYKDFLCYDHTKIDEDTMIENTVENYVNAFMASPEQSKHLKKQKEYKRV